MQSLQQSRLRFVSQLCCVSPAHVHSQTLHSFHYELSGRCSRWVDDRVDFWRRTEAEFAVTPPAIQAIKVRAAQCQSLPPSVGRELRRLSVSFLGAFIERRSQTVSLAHAGLFEGTMKMVEPALASHAGCWHGFRTSWMTQRRRREYTKQHYALHYLRVFSCRSCGGWIVQPYRHVSDRTIPTVRFYLLALKQ